MNDELILLDPSAERSPIVRQRRARSASIAGARFGLLDINKARGDVFLQRLEELRAELLVDKQRILADLRGDEVTIGAEEDIVAAIAKAEGAQ